MARRKTIECYKLAQPDGWDFRTGCTINYRGDGTFPHTVRVPNPRPALGVCSPGVIHASVRPEDCFVGARIPCSAYRVRGVPVAEDKRKYGFVELEVLEEITDLDSLFPFNYTEACNPINPFLAPRVEVTGEMLDILREWSRVWTLGLPISTFMDGLPLLWITVRDGIWNRLLLSMEPLYPIWRCFPDKAWDSAVSCAASYAASLFKPGFSCPGMSRRQWKSFQVGAGLWRRGVIPSFDGEVWRLHSGEKAAVIWEGRLT